MSKTLVLYVFHEYNNRVEHFIHHCIFKDNNVDFIIICNNKDTNFKFPSYVSVLFRDNIGYDFGGWSDALITYDLYKKYDHFIFGNSSIIGPYLHSTFQGKWTDVYIQGLQNNIKLFGSTINTCEQPLTHSHVQSYLFVMDKITLQYLIDCEIFSITNYANSYVDAIWNKEVLMSRKIIENGWNIGSCMTYYKYVDFTFKTKQPHEYEKPFLDNVMRDSSCRNIIWNEYELVFIKGNKEINISLPNYSEKMKLNLEI